MELSIVIPAFEEREKITRDIETSAVFLSTNHLSGEVIVVDDGSKDNTTEAAKSVVVSPDVRLRTIRYEKHRGKGHAVRKGVEQTSGQYVMFADSGCCVPYEDVFRGLELLKSDVCDIAHGSRKIQTSHIERAQSLFRRVCSRMFHWFVVHYMKIPAELTDTQCGFKIYKGNVARDLYGQCITDGFSFDIEIILRALKQGYRIKEFPIDWTCDPDSRLSPARNSRLIFLELLHIRKVLDEE